MDSALLGIARRIGLPPVPIYSSEKIVALLVRNDGMTWEEAWEYFEFNIAGSGLGENGPVFLDEMP
jgi:hypothetical protein